MIIDVSFGLTGKRAVIVGAGPGMGRACALALAREGASVVCMTRTEENAGVVAAAVRELGVRGVAVVGDAGKRADVERLVETATQELGGVDICIDLVGSAVYGTLLELSDDNWAANFEQCLKHAFLLAQIGGRQMSEQGTGGAMVFISSTSSLSAAPGHGAYGAAKAAMNSMIQTLAFELGERQIRVNAIAAGSIDTPASRELRTDEQRRLLAGAVPLQRMGAADDIAHAVLFLASDLAGYITGQTIAVDGGVSVNPFWPKLSTLFERPPDDGDGARASRHEWSGLQSR